MQVSGSTTAAISGVTLTGGNGADQQLVSGRRRHVVPGARDELTLTNVTISGNTATLGGGIANSGGTLT